MWGSKFKSSGDTLKVYRYSCKIDNQKISRYNLYEELLKYVSIKIKIIMLKSQLVRITLKLHVFIVDFVCSYKKLPMPSHHTFFGLYRAPNDPLGKTVLLGLSIEDIHSVAL